MRSNKKTSHVRCCGYIGTDGNVAYAISHNEMVFVTISNYERIAGRVMCAACSDAAHEIRRANNAIKVDRTDRIKHTPKKIKDLYVILKYLTYRMESLLGKLENDQYGVLVRLRKEITDKLEYELSFIME